MDIVPRNEHTPNIDAAFQDAQSEARFKYGNGGYTGSIAEKTRFIEVDVADNGNDAMQMAAQHLESQRFAGNDAPAGCITIGDAGWLFFGWARE